MLKMMTATGARQMKIVAVGLVKFELSLQTLVAVIIKLIIVMYSELLQNENIIQFSDP